MKFALLAGREAAATLPAIAVAAVFICLIALQGYDFWESQQAVQAPVAAIAPAQTAMQRAPAVDTVAAKHLFGDAESIAPQYSDVKEDKTLNLTLRGIVAADGSRTSHAIIQSGPNNEETFALGDNVFNKGKLDFIASDHIILARSNGQLAKLQLPEEESSGLSSEEYLPSEQPIYIEPENTEPVNRFGRETVIPEMEQTVDNFVAPADVPLPEIQPDFPPESEPLAEPGLEPEIVADPAEPIYEEHNPAPTDEHQPE